MRDEQAEFDEAAVARPAAPIAQQHELREFVGFVWQDDWSERTGVILRSGDVSEAAAVLKAAYGPTFRVSVWNEQDAEKPR